MDWYDRLTTATWIDSSSGRKISVEDMTSQEARNVLIFLDRHDQGVVMAAAKALAGRPADVEQTAMMDDPRKWLVNTPLVQALAECATPCIGPHSNRTAACASSQRGDANDISASSEALGVVIPFRARSPRRP